MEVNQGQLLKLISVIKKSVEVNHSMKLFRTPKSNDVLTIEIDLTHGPLFQTMYVDKCGKIYL